MKKYAMATGIAAAYMNGWRRPSRERVLSDQKPMIGSHAASIIIAMKIAVPANEPGSPSTWL
jgi:hypothetical protein